jgi:hypothetical protein
MCVPSYLGRAAGRAFRLREWSASATSPEHQSTIYIIINSKRHIVGKNEQNIIINGMLDHNITPVT